MQFPREHKTQTTWNKSDLDPREISEETVLVHKKVGKCQLEGLPLTMLKDSYGDYGECICKQATVLSFTEAQADSSAKNCYHDWEDSRWTEGMGVWHKNNSRNSSCFTVTSEAGEKVWDFQKKVKEMFNVF